jgi:hypothetical protein
VWETLLKYAVPLGVGLYGLLVLATGSIGGLGSRVTRGAPARVLGGLLVGVAVLAVAVDPKSPFGPTMTRGELDAMKRELEIGREVLGIRKQELDWARDNAPARPDPDGDPATRLKRSEEFLKASEAFAAERKRRGAEMDQKVKELAAEQTRLREEREAEANRRQEARRSGAWLVALAGLLLVWGLAWLAGRPEDEPPVTSSPGGGAEAGPGSPST